MGLVKRVAQYLDEFAFAFVVCISPVTECAGKIVFQNGVSARIFRMSSEVVPEGDMPPILLAVGWADIKVMGNVAWWSAKGFTAGNA
jgi:hypothetical protein